MIGLLSLAVLPFIKPADNPAGDGGGAGRARVMALVLALGCLAWIPFRAGLLPVGTAAPIFETLFTLIFVASAVFLGAGAIVLGPTAGLLSRLGLVMAPLLLAMYLRKWWPQADWLYYVVPVAAALLLLAQSRLSWQALRVVDAAPAPATA